MAENNRPMFVIKDTENVELDENHTASSNLAEVSGGKTFKAVRNTAGATTNANQQKSLPRTSFITWFLKNITKIIIGIIIAVITTFIGHLLHIN